MKRVITYTIFFLIVLGLSAQGYTEVELTDDRCYPDGSISFLLANDKTDMLNISEVSMVAQNAYIRNMTLVPKGMWTENESYFNLSEGKLHTSTFISEENQIREPGDYYLFLRYTGCRKGECKTSAYLKNCLAHHSDCVRYKTVMYDCTVDPEQNMAFIRFGGEKSRFYRDVDVTRDLLFFISSDTRDLLGVRRIEGMSVSRLGDVREIRFPLLKGEMLSDAAIVHNRCNSPFQQQKKIACTAGARKEKRGIGNGLTAEQVSVSVPLPAKAEEKAEKAGKAKEENEPAHPAAAETAAQQITSQKEQETGQKVEALQHELEQTRAERDAYKQIAEAAEPAVPPAEPEPLGEITGSAVGGRPEKTKSAQTGVPAHFIVLITLVATGIVLLIATNYKKKKKEKQRRQQEEQKRREKSFGFGD